MNFLDVISEKWTAFYQKMQPAMDSVKNFLQNAKRICSRVWRYLLRFRKVFAVVPVAWGTVYLAVYNMKHLPDTVGMVLQNDGRFEMLISREQAVLGPVAFTALCVLLMLGSKRILTPWLVSLFSLAIPLIILVTNIFPA